MPDAPPPSAWTSIIVMLAAWNPTQGQWQSYIRTVFKVIGTLLAQGGITLAPKLQDAFFGDQAVMFYSGIAMVVVPVIFDRLSHSRSGTLKAAAALPSVVKIEVKHDAPADVQAVVKDDKVPNVVTVPGPPPPLSVVKADIAAQKATDVAKP
jgi:hypothetical protein